MYASVIMNSKISYIFILLITLAVTLFTVNLTLITNEGQAATAKEKAAAKKKAEAKRKANLKNAKAQCSKKFKKDAKKKKACINQAKEKYQKKSGGSSARAGGQEGKISPGPTAPVPPPAKPIPPKSLELEGTFKAQKSFQSEMLNKKNGKVKITASQRKAYYNNNGKLASATNKVVNGTRKASWKAYLKAQHDYDLAVELNDLYVDIIPDAKTTAVECETDANITFTEAVSEITITYDEQLQEVRTFARDEINELKSEKLDVVSSLKSSVSKYRVIVKSTRSAIKLSKKSKTYKGKTKTKLAKKLSKAKLALQSKKASLKVNKSNYNAKIQSKRDSLAQDVDDIEKARAAAIVPYALTLTNDLALCESAWTVAKDSYETQKTQLIDLAKSDWDTNGLTAINSKSNAELVRVSDLQAAIKTTIGNIPSK